jgi:plastocyanin
MSKYPKFLVLFLALCIGITFLLVPLGAQEEKERIKGEEMATFLVRVIEQAGLFPQVAKVKPGTTVVWVNTWDKYVEIFFTGKQVEVACKSPVHFMANPTEGGFYSDRIPPGAVASLCFIEKGTFEYTAQPATWPYRPELKAGKEIKGTIVVE